MRKNITCAFFPHQVGSALIAALPLFVYPGTLLAATPLYENFEDGSLDSQITASRVGTFSSMPGIKAVTNFGSTKAYGFGRSTCGANCFESYTSSLNIALASKTFVTTISFKEMELYGDWGSQGKVFIDGIYMPPQFGREPGNTWTADTTYRIRTYTVNKAVSKITLLVRDITNSSEIFVDDLRINTSNPVVWLPPTNADVCWKDAASGSLIRVRFSAVGAEFYQFVGKMVESDGLINPTIGSTVVTPAALLGTSTHSGSTPTNYWGEVANWTIDRYTKVLAFKAIGMERESSAPYYSMGSATFITCP